MLSINLKIIIKPLLFLKQNKISFHKLKSYLSNVDVKRVKESHKALHDTINNNKYIYKLYLRVFLSHRLNSDSSFDFAHLKF
jgi:hypothetical protein